MYKPFSLRFSNYGVFRSSYPSLTNTFSNTLKFVSTLFGMLGHVMRQSNGYLIMLVKTGAVLMSMNFDEHSPIRKLVESHITKLGKLYNELQKTHPVSFILLPSSIEVIQFYWQHIVLEGERAISFYGAGN